MSRTSVDATSILETVRKEAFREGYAAGKDHNAQLAQCQSDEDYERGRQDAKEVAPSRFYWFMFGIIISIIFNVIVLSLFMPSATLTIHG